MKSIDFDDFIKWTKPLFLWVIMGFGIYFFFGGEQEGAIQDMESCKEIIMVEDKIYNRIFTKYSCHYKKDLKTGEIISGECYNAEFNDNGICIKLKMYEKQTKKIESNGFDKFQKWQKEQNK